MSDARKCLMWMVCTYLGLLGVLWVQVIEGTRGEMLYAKVALEATREAEVAWARIALRQGQDTTLAPRDREYPATMRDRTADLADELAVEVRRLEGKLGQLTLGRYRPEEH